MMKSLIITFGIGCCLAFNAQAQTGTDGTDKNGLVRPVVSQNHMQLSPADPGTAGKNQVPRDQVKTDGNTMGVKKAGTASAELRPRNTSPASKQDHMKLSEPQH